MSPKAWLVVIGFVVGMAAVVIAVRVMNYMECRAHGFSILFCVAR